MRSSSIDTNVSLQKVRGKIAPFIKHIFLLIFSIAPFGLVYGIDSKHEINRYSNLEVKPSNKTTVLKVGVVGLVHTHVHWILGREEKGDIEIVAIVEPNKKLASEYAKQHGFSMDIVFDSMEEMIENTKVEAVTAFNTIYDHLEVVKFCAPKGIHVMVEKPLAVSLEHALEMRDLAKKHQIHLLTNYETSWYKSLYTAYDAVNHKEKLGKVSKMVFRTGHMGPIEIGCNPEFLEWLTDPLLNGGGALTDFGCYGANITTWILNGELPYSVSCTAQQIKPEMYPKVEDEATIVLAYPSKQVIIQASWNWPMHIKDTKIYGKKGSLHSKNKDELSFTIVDTYSEEYITTETLPPGTDDPFALLQKVVHENYKLAAFDPSSLENNMIVMKILHAAKISARSNQIVLWKNL